MPIFTERMYNHNLLVPKMNYLIVLSFSQRTFFAIGLLFLAMPDMKAQFSGISSFFYDTVLRERVRTNQVRMVTEFVKDSTRVNNGFYLFDRKGRVTEINTRHGNGFNRKQFVYNEAGQIVRERTYEHYDTTKVEFWKTRTFDDQNRLLKEEKGQVYGGKVLEGPSIEARYRADDKGRNHIEYKRYIDYRPQPASVSVGHDSVSGKFRFDIIYEYSPEMMDAPGKKFGTKTVTRTYTLNGCGYYDVLTYNSFGSEETVREINTRYTQFDGKGRITGFGSISYDEAFMDFAQENPEDYMPGFFSPSFVQAFFDLKIQGRKEPELVITYDKKGREAQRVVGDTRYSFTYNKKGQVTEQLQENEKFDSTRTKLKYNNKGLVSSATISTWRPTDKKNITHVVEYSYHYSYF